MKKTKKLNYFVVPASIFNGYKPFFACDICGFSFMTVPEVKKHLKTYHEESVQTRGKKNGKKRA